VPIIKGRVTSVPAGVESHEVYVQVTRADGTVEPEYLAAYWHRRFWQRWKWYFRHNILGKTTP
jgi:hypothetical protein